MNSIRINKLFEILKPYGKDVEKPKEPNLNVSEMWKSLIIQICIRGGSKAIESLTERGELDSFLSQLSFEQMPLSHEKILKVLCDFRTTRFRPSASKTIIENFQRCFYDNEFKFIHLLTKNLPSRELTKDRVLDERKVRNELKKHFVWVFRRGSEWKIYNWKNKPVSDWLKDIGFAVTLMPFDTRVTNILKELGIRVTDKNYEDVEDIFINRICPKLELFPVQIDKIFYEKYGEIMSLIT
jgi:hypothetical protein